MYNNLWKPADKFDWSGKKKLKALSCYLGKVYYIHQGRSAWNWSWSSTYPGDGAFHATLDEAKKKIESQRVQGSTWNIHELPAIVMQGKDLSLVVCEINTDAPLHDASREAIPSKSLFRLYEHFEPIKDNSIFRFVAGSNRLSPAHLPYIRHKSVSYGGNSSLGWYEGDYNPKLDSILTVFSRIVKLFQK